MRNVILAGASLALLSACGAQTDETAAPEKAAEATPEAAVPAEPPVAAEAPNAAAGSYAVGDTVEVAVQTECREVGPNADETPWDFYPGVTKEVLAVEGDQLRVKAGDVECLVPTKDVKPD
jgi:hypothetical protein